MIVGKFKSQGCILIVTLLFFILSLPLAAEDTDEFVSSSRLVGTVSYDYHRMFELSRRVLTRKAARVFLKEVFAEELTISPELQAKYGFPEKIKDISETQFMLILQRNPEFFEFIDTYLDKIPPDAELDFKNDKLPKQLVALKDEWVEKFQKLLEQHPEIRRDFHRQNDLEVPFHLKTEDGSPGYRSLRFYANHLRIINGKPKAPDNLVEKIVNFIGLAKKQLIVNVYDFDLHEIADALIEAGKRGVDVTIGIDKGNIEEREAVREIYEKLESSGKLNVVAVDAVGLNHQKMLARDWENPKQAEVVLSSANFTASGIHPKGDLHALKPVPKQSIPNANHIIILKSQPLATLINHELRKALHLDPERRLRGREFPLNGVYRIDGPKRGKYMLMAFSPQGALGSINKHLIGNAIRETSGPIHMLQFAFSSDDVEDALRERAAREIKAGKKFDFHSLGETPFAMTFWSVFLSMAGYQRNRETGEYTVNEESPWFKVLGKRGMAALRRNILVAPRTYGHHSIRRDGVTHQATAKIHHKTAAFSREVAIAGTSFNFSSAAGKQPEQLALFVDKKVADNVRGMYYGIESMGRRTLNWIVQRRQQWFFRENAEAEEHYETTPGNNREAIQAAKDATASTKKGGDCGVVASLSGTTTATN